MVDGVMARAVTFAAEMLRKNPNLTTKELSTAGRKVGINLYPVVIGKARKAAGLGRGKPGRRPAAGAAKVAAKPVARIAPVAKRAPGRPAAGPTHTSDALGALDALIHVGGEVKRLSTELAAAQAKLAKIAEILGA